MKSNTLIETIQKAFENVQLEDGIGLWEAQGLDDYADEQTLQKLRLKDERINWNQLSYQDLVTCESSLSFFDAKGMRFHLPKFLIFDLLEEELLASLNLLPPEILFTLSLIHQTNQFSLFDALQTEAVIAFLKNKKQDSDNEDNEWININKILLDWENHLEIIQH